MKITRFLDQSGKKEEEVKSLAREEKGKICIDLIVWKLAVEADGYIKIELI